MPVTTLLLSLAILTVAGFTQGLTGFGFGLVSMALLPLLLPLHLVAPLLPALLPRVRQQLPLRSWEGKLVRALPFGGTFSERQPSFEMGVTLCRHQTPRRSLPMCS